jgi:hypothetical protein
MRLQSNTLICGIPARDLRDMFRYLREGVRADHVALRLKINTGEADALIRDLVARGYLELSAERDDMHELTEKGNAVINARFLKPISRARADVLAKAFVERAETVNANAHLVWIVEEVVVFGSYADPAAPDVADLDLAVTLLWRPGMNSVTKESEHRADRSGKCSGQWLRRMIYGETEVKMLLKNRSPYISIHRMDDLEHAVHTRQLFKADPAKVKPFQREDEYSAALAALEEVIAELPENTSQNSPT